MIPPHHFRRARRGAKRGWRDASGAAMVEFALILPIVLAFLLGIVEFGRLWNVRQVMTDAAREGARVAVVNNNRSLTQAQLQARVRTAIRQRVATAALDTVGTRLTINFTNVTGAAQPGTTAIVAVEYNYPLWFGQTLLQRDNLPLRSTFSMRNE